jgi:hypothetical protein
MNIEPQNHSISIKNLLKHKIGIPLFQRGYSWGVNENSNKPLKYFQDFLSNENIHHDFGNLFVYCLEYYEEEKWQNPKFYTDKKDSEIVINPIHIYLTDGQHRLSTLVLSLLAVQTYLNSKYTKCIIDEFLNSKISAVIKTGNGFQNQIETLLKRDIFDILNHINMEIIVDNEQTIINIKDVINQNKEHTKTPAYKAYSQILNHFINTNDLPVNLNVIKTFLDRLNYLKSIVKILQNDSPLNRTEEQIKIQAYNMFIEMNGQAIQLKDYELLSSFVKQPKLIEYSRKTSVNSLFQKPKKGTTIDVVEVFKYFNVDSINDKFDYFFKSNLDNNYNINDGSTWIRDIIGIHDNDKQMNIIDKMKVNISDLKLLNDIFKHKSEDENNKLNKDFLFWESGDIEPYMLDIYDLYVKKSIPTIIYGTKTLKDFNQTNQLNSKNKKHKIFLEKLIRVMLMLSLMRTYNGRASRPNTSRDILELNFNVQSGFSFFADHFVDLQNIDPQDTQYNPNDANIIFKMLKDTFKKHICECIFTNYTSEAKIILILAEAKEGKSTFNNILNKNFDLEHILAQNYKFKNNNEIDLITDQYEKKCESLYSEVFLKSPNSINLIGNMALLDKNINRSIQNISPLAKNNLTNQQIGWWSTHYSKLKKSNGEWGIDTINSDTQTIADNTINWLFEGFDYSDLTSKFEKQKIKP